MIGDDARAATIGSVVLARQLSLAEGAEGRKHAVAPSAERVAPQEPKNSEDTWVRSGVDCLAISIVSTVAHRRIAVEFVLGGIAECDHYACLGQAAIRLFSYRVAS